MSRGAPTRRRSSASTASVPDPESFESPSERESAERALDLHGPHRRHPDARHRRRHRLHRFVHEQPHRGPAGRGRGGRRTHGHGQAGDGRAGLGGGEAAGRGRRTRHGLPRRRLRLAGAGLLDVPRHEPRQARAAGALRVHLEPQLRRTSGSRWSHAPRLPRRRRGHRRRRALRHSRRTCDEGRPRRHRHRGPARPQRRRHRPDHPERLAEAGRAHRLRQGPVLRVARRPLVRAERRTLRGRLDPRRRTELRHRLVARARGLGDHGLRLRGGDLASLRRHLPQQLHEERPRAGAGAC